MKKLAYHSTVRKLRSWHPVPIHSSWQIDGETGETVSDFIFLGSKITADGGYSHKIKRCLLLGRKVMTNLDSKLKSRDFEEEKLKLYITSCSFCLCNSACSLQSLDHVGHVVSESGDLIVLGTGAYLTHSCPALCNCPAPATCLIMPVCVKVRHPPLHLDCCSCVHETP